MRTLLLLIAFLTTYPCCLWGGGMITGVLTSKTGPTFEFFPADKIRMDVAFDREFTKCEDHWARLSGTIYCRWRNEGKKSVKLLLKEQDSYFGALDYPYGIRVRIEGPDGVIITSGSDGKDGWWSSAFVNSQLSKVSRCDVVTLRPGASIIRAIPLQKVLFGLSMVRGEQPLSRGTYKIELRLGGISAKKPLSIQLGSELSEETTANSH